MNEKKLIANLISIFVIAFALTTYLHELAHAIVAKILHIHPILYHSYVSFDSSAATDTDQLYIFAAGPLFSLFQALLFITLVNKRTKVDLVSFLFFWLATIGMIVFLGYIMMGAFIPYGDTGTIYGVLSIPNCVSYPLAVFALLCLIIFSEN